VPDLSTSLTHHPPSFLPLFHFFLLAIRYAAPLSENASRWTSPRAAPCPMEQAGNANSNSGWVYDAGDWKKGCVQPDGEEGGREGGREGGTGGGEGRGLGAYLQESMRSVFLFNPVLLSPPYAQQAIAAWRTVCI